MMLRGNMKYRKEIDLILYYGISPALKEVLKKRIDDTTGVKL